MSTKASPCNVDWLEFTWQVPDYVSDSEDHLEHFLCAFPEFRHYHCQQLDHGMLNYSTVYEYVGAWKVLVNPLRRDMGVHVIFPGSACPCLKDIFQLEDTDGFLNACTVLKIIDERGVKWTRIDIAFDDYTKTYTPLDYINFQFQGRIRSNCKRGQFNVSNFHSNATGCTWYLGSSANGRFVRVYDKAVESHGEINAIRYEIQFRKKWAASIVKTIIDNYSSIDFASLITDMFEVVDLPFEASTDGSLAVARHRAVVNQTFLGILESQVSRRVKVTIPTKMTLENLNKLWAFVYNMRRPMKIFSLLYSPDKLQSIIDSYIFKNKDLSVCQRLLNEYLLSTNFSKEVHAIG